MWTTALVAFFAGSSLAAGPTGPAVVVKQEAPPDVLVTGVRTLQIGAFAGTDVDVASQVKAGLADKERLKTDAAALGKEVLGMATDLGSQYLGGLVGGGIQGKLVQGLTKNTVEAVSDALESEPLILDSGLTIDVFQVVESGADAVLGGAVRIEDKVEDFTTKEAVLDSNGAVQTDAKGNAITREVPCRRRTVDVVVAWTIQGTGAAEGTVSKQTGDSRCGAQISELLDAQTLAQPLLTDIGMLIVRDVAPAWRVRRLALNKSKVLKEAMKFVNKSEWEPARCAIRAAALANPEDSDAVFDDAVMLEAFGHHALAAARYDEAIAIKDKNVYGKARERLAKRMTEVDAMVQSYGLTWTVPADPPACN